MRQRHSRQGIIQSLQSLEESHRQFYAVAFHAVAPYDLVGIGPLQARIFDNRFLAFKGDGLAALAAWFSSFFTGVIVVVVVVVVGGGGGIVDFSLLGDYFRCHDAADCLLRAVLGGYDDEIVVTYRVDDDDVTV